MAFLMASPIFVIVSATSTPADLSASFFASAVSAPLFTIAPAWPSFLPLGAAAPATKAATGFFDLELHDFINSAPSISAVPPISPISTIPSVSVSFKKSSKASL